MSNITDIERFSTGYAFTLDTPPSTGWDVWLDGQRIETRLDDTYYFYRTSSETPPTIEVVAAYSDTPSMTASTQARLQWQHYGALYYVIEVSNDNVTFARIGTVYANGNVFHNFDVTADDGTTYYRVYAAEPQGDSYRVTSLPLPCIVTQALIPEAPSVQVEAVSGNAYIARTEIFGEEELILK